MPSNFVIRNNLRSCCIDPFITGKWLFKIYSECLKMYFVQCYIVTSVFLWIVFALYIFFLSFKFYPISVLVCLGCHDNIPQTEWLKEQTFSHSSGGFKFKSRGLTGLVSGGISRSGLQTAAFWLVLTWPFFCVLTERSLVFPLLLIGQQPLWIKALLLWHHLTLITILKALPPNTVTLGVRASTYKFEGNIIRCISYIFIFKVCFM